MNLDASNVADDSQLRRAVSGIGRSAEYSIAIALFAVCLVAGGTLWFLNLREPATVQLPPPTVATAAAPTSSADEKATVEALQRGLDAKFDQIDQKRRVEEAAAERARQQAAAQEAAEAAAARAAAEEATRRAQAAAAAKLAASRPVRVDTPPPPPPVAPPAQPKVEVAAAAPVVAPARTEAAIDWSTCRRPPYPADSMKRMEEGTTVVKVDLDPTGKVLGSSIAQSSGFPRLDGATQRAVVKCQFRAATVDGVAQASATTVRIAWSLGDKDMLGR